MGIGGTALTTSPPAVCQFVVELLIEAPTLGLGTATVNGKSGCSSDVVDPSINVEIDQDGTQIGSLACSSGVETCTLEEDFEFVTTRQNPYTTFTGVGSVSWTLSSGAWEVVSPVGCLPLVPGSATVACSAEAEFRSVGLLPSFNVDEPPFWGVFQEYAVGVPDPEEIDGDPALIPLSCHAHFSLIGEVDEDQFGDQLGQFDSFAQGNCNPYADYASAKAEVHKNNVLVADDADPCTADLPNERCEQVSAEAFKTCVNTCAGTWKLLGRTRFRVPLDYIWIVNSSETECTYDPVLDRWTCEASREIVVPPPSGT